MRYEEHERARATARSRSALIGVSSVQKSVDELDPREAFSLVLAQSAAMQAWASVAPPDENRFGQVVPRHGLFNALFAATTALVVEHQFGRKARYERLLLGVDTFVSECLAQLRKQQSERLAGASDETVARAVDELGAVELPDRTAAWREIAPR